MHSTVPGAVRLGLEPRFAYWPVARDEEGHIVRGARLRGDLHLRIRAGARSPRGRLCVTAGAAIQVEPRPEAGFRTGYGCLALDRLDLLELVLACREKRPFVRVQAVNRPTRARRASTDTGILGRRYRREIWHSWDLPHRRPAEERERKNEEHHFRGRGWKRFSSKGFVVTRRCGTVGGLCGRRHADLSVPRMVHCPVARRHLDGGSVRRIGALGVVVSLVALVSASAADGAGPGPAKDVFTAIVGSILGGPTSGVHGTDGRHHVVYELVLTNAKAVPATLQAVEGLDPEHDARPFPFQGKQILRLLRALNARPASNLDLPPSESRVVLLSLDFPSARAVPRLLDHRIEALAAVSPAAKAPSSVEYRLAPFALAARETHVFRPPLEGT